MQAVMSELVLEMKRVSLGDQTHRDATEASQLQLGLTETRQRLVTAHYPQIQEVLNFHLARSCKEDASKHRSRKIFGWIQNKA